MANTYYDSELTGEQIEQALTAIDGLIIPSNNGKIVAVQNGRLVAKSASEWSGEATLESLSVTANGDYFPGVGVDGFDEVHVAVPSSSPTIQPLSVRQNGTYTAPSGVDGYSPVTVNVSGGGGGSTNILSGTDIPTASVGSEGDIYLQYYPHTTTFKQEYIVETTDQILSTHSSVFKKLTSDFAIAMEIKSSPGWIGPIVISPTQGGAAYTSNTAEIPVIINEETWYFAGSNNWNMGIDAPTIPTNYTALLPHPYTASAAQAWAELLYDSAKADPGMIFASYCKVNGVWQDLIGTDINDVNLGS